MNDVDIDSGRLRRFAAVGICPQCRQPLDGASISGSKLECARCSTEVRAEAGVVLALRAERRRAQDHVSAVETPCATTAPLQGWAAGIAADMDSKSASYVDKYGRLTRSSHGFFTRRDLALELAGPTPGRVLEPGCGPGVVSPLLARRAVDTHGVDLSAGQLRTAAARDPLTLYVQGDLQALPYRDGAFDSVVLLGVLEYIESPESVLRELARVLAERGRLVVSVPNAAGLPRRWTHHAYLPLSRLAKRGLGRPVPAYYRRLYTASGLTGLLEEAGFRVERAQFFDLMLAAPPLDRLLGNRPPRVAGYWKSD